MKKLQRGTYCFLYYLLILFITSCNKPEPEPSPIVVSSKQMAGQVIWPANAHVDTTGVKVTSFQNAVSIKNGSFAVDTINIFSTVIIAKPNGDILMMRYNYPGQLDNNISPQSTVLAILMNAPITISLSDKGQLQMIQKIQADPNFDTMVQEVTKAVVAGKPINDTTNASLITATSRLFKTVSALRTSASREVPIIIKTANPGTISFLNNNVSHKYVVGVYEKDKRIDKFIIEGSKAFASSFTDVLNGAFGDGYSSPDQKIYTNTNNGNYLFKIRSGKPGSDDNSAESKEAFNENVIKYVWELIRKHMPIGGGKCTNTAYQGIKGMIDGTKAFHNAKTPEQFADAVLEYCSHILTTNTSMFADCSHYKEPNYKNPYWTAVGKFFKFFDKVGKVGEGINIAAYAFDLYNSKPAIDTCFQVLEKKVIPCGLDTLAILRSKKWSLTNGPIRTNTHNTICPNLKDLLQIQLNEASLTFELVNGETRVTESGNGVFQYATHLSGPHSIDLVNCKITKEPPIKPTEGSNSYDIRLSNKKFITSNPASSPYSMGPLLYSILRSDLGNEIISFKENELIVRNNRYWNSVPMIFKGN
jgi:hypothetical protein